MSSRDQRYGEDVRGVSVAKGPRSSLRGIDPQGFVLGGPGGGVEEVGQDECQGVEKNVEEVEERNSKDDCMTKDEDGFIFFRATP